MGTITQLERYKGAMLGLACGDALGTTLEFKQPGTFKAIDDMIGGGPFRLKAGQWTDDTSMALCLAQSLIEKGHFDPADQMERYVRWYREGYLSSTGTCFDIGNTVRNALEKFERAGDPFSGSTNPRSAGNGSIMRLAPVPLAYAAEPEKALELSAQSSRTTHGAETAVAACRYLAGLIIGALNGVDKETLLSDSYTPVAGYWDKHPLPPEILNVANGFYKVRMPPFTTNVVTGLLGYGTTQDETAIRGTGYVVKSLEAALWAFYRSASFEEGCLKAVNLGDDADTTGAVYGQLAGAYYGVNGIPAKWREKLAEKEMIENMAEQLYRMAQKDA